MGARAEKWLSDLRRLNWKIKDVMPINKERGLYHLDLELDERYYEKTVRDGEEGYFSKKDDLFIPMKVLRKTIEGIRSIPLYYRPPRISDISEYVEERRENRETSSGWKRTSNGYQRLRRLLRKE